MPLLAGDGSRIILATLAARSPDTRAIVLAFVVKNAKLILDNIMTWAYCFTSVYSYVK